MELGATCPFRAHRQPPRPDHDRRGRDASALWVQPRLIQFSTDKGRQAARGGRLQSRPLKAPFGDLEDFDRVREVL